MSEPHRRFLSLFKALNTRFEYEDSCKFTSGRLLADRCLVSFGRSAICGKDGDLSPVKYVLQSLEVPASYDAWLMQHHGNAGVIHFGLEAEAGRTVYKVYLEYAQEARLALSIAGGLQMPVIVHRALKWCPGADQLQETLYRLMPSDGLTLDERLAMHGGEGEHRSSGDLARGILRQALTRTGARDIVLLDVVDVGTKRHSFDLQIYDARMRMGDIQEKVMLFGSALGIPQDALTAFFFGRTNAILGHIAGGRDALGQAFFTLYYGAQTL